MARQPPNPDAGCDWCGQDDRTQGSTLCASCEADPSRVLYEEDIAGRWARVLLACAETHDAPVFALRMAEQGLSASHLREWAETWRTEGFEPADFEGALQAFADQIERANRPSGGPA